jgi:hypothetical protein
MANITLVFSDVVGSQADPSGHDETRSGCGISRAISAVTVP